MYIILAAIYILRRFTGNIWNMRLRFRGNWLYKNVCVLFTRFETSVPYLRNTCNKCWECLTSFSMRKSPISVSGVRTIEEQEHFYYYIYFGKFICCLGLYFHPIVVLILKGIVARGPNTVRLILVTGGTHTSLLSEKNHPRTMTSNGRAKSVAAAANCKCA